MSKSKDSVATSYLDPAVNRWRDIVHVRQPFVYDAVQVSNDTGLSCLDVSRAKQEFKDECDINVIVDRFGLSGVMPKNHRVAMFGDFEGIHDIHSAMNRLRDAEYAFMSMPPTVRERFGNSPQMLMEFLGDAANADEARKLGLMDPVAAPEAPLLVRVVPPADTPNPPPKSAA